MSRPLRERLDLGLFLRRLFGSRFFRLVRVLPRWRVSLPKEYCVHGVVLLIVGAAVGANLLTTSSDRGSLLFALFGESEIEEGPLVPRGEPQRTRGALLGLIAPAVAGGVSEGDIEFELANTLGGNALVAAAPPDTAEASGVLRRGIVAHTVQEGDTPASIAARFGVSTNTVLWSNGIQDGDVIRPGDILVILPVSGVLHTVASGDDLTSIALKYDAKIEDIIAQNNLSGDGGAIQTGSKLVIPDGQIRVAPRRLAVHEEPAGERLRETPDPLATPRSPGIPGSGFLRPVAFRAVSQYFGWRHTGIDLSGRDRPMVRSAQRGTVSFSGWLGGYGRLVIVDHGGGLRTYYAHLSEMQVKAGQTIARGEAVGRVGSSGRSTGPHLHFEVRVQGRPVNPLRYF